MSTINSAIKGMGKLLNAKRPDTDVQEIRIRLHDDTIMHFIADMIAYEVEQHPPASRSDPGS